MASVTSYHDMIVNSEYQIIKIDPKTASLAK